MYINKNYKNILLLGALSLSSSLFAKNIELANMNIKQNFISNKTLDILLSQKVIPKENIVSLKELIQKVIPTNAKIRALRLELESAKLELKSEMNNRLPSVDVSARTSLATTSKDVWNKPNLEADRSLNPTDKDTYNEVGQYKYGVYLNLDLYKGGELNIRRKMALNSVKFTQNQLETLIEKEVLKIINIYLELGFVSEKKEKAIDSLKTLEKFMLNAQTKFEGGAISKGDLNSIKALFYAQKAIYIELSSTEYQKESLYDFLIGEELNHLKPKKMDIIFKFDTLENLLEKLSNNSSIKNEKIKTHKIKLDKELSTAVFKPSVKFALNYTDIGRVPTNFIESDEDRSKSYTALLELRYSLFNQGRDQNVYKKRIIAMKRQKINMSFSKKELEYNLRRSFLTIDSLKRNVDNKEIQLKNIIEMLANFHDLYEGGKNLVKKILDGENNKYRTEIKIIENKENYYKEYYKVKSLTGDLIQEFDLDFNFNYNNSQYPIKNPKLNKLDPLFINTFSSKLKKYTKAVSNKFDVHTKKGLDKIKELKLIQKYTDLSSKPAVDMKIIVDSNIPKTKIEIVKDKIEVIKNTDSKKSLSKKEIIEELNLSRKEINLSKEDIMNQLKLFK